MSSPYDRIPPLAGVATYASAARVGWSVDENVRRLLRLHWVERRLMAIMVAHLAAEPVWEVKCALALHQWQCAEHVDALRRRVAEMRSPVPPLDRVPEEAAALDAFLDEVRASRGTAELLVALYDVALPALAGAYRAHLDGSNPLVDHPTRRVVRAALAETDEAVAWGTSALAALGEPASNEATGRSAGVSAWSEHLRGLLADAGGIAGDQAVSSGEGPFASRGAGAPGAERGFMPDFHPRRDERFVGQYNFEFPPHVVYNLPGVPADERNLALLCKRALEMDVPEMMASFITERASQPWEFHRDYARQLWDEARHAMMGSVALEARGVDWRREIPLNVSFALRLNLHATPVERQLMLHAIEQSLMPGETGKRFEYETAVAAGDALSAHFHDYDWADEVLHAQIGRRALKREGITSDEARARAHAIHEQTWAALDRYRSREPQSAQWWPALVRRVLGHEAVSHVETTAPLGTINVFSE